MCVDNKIVASNFIKQIAKDIFNVNIRATWNFYKVN